MNFENLIGKTFQETELYELLLLELEEKFEQNFSKFMHFYFVRTAHNNIRITEIVHFLNSIDIHKKNREIIEKREWFEIARNHNHLNLILCRFDRTGLHSSIWKDSTRTQEWSRSWADEEPDLGPMTPEEIRQAVCELRGFFEDQQELQKSKSKKAV